MNLSWRLDGACGQNYALGEKCAYGKIVPTGKCEALSKTKLLAYFKT